MTRSLSILLALISISIWNESNCAETDAETLAKLLKSESELHRQANQFRSLIDHSGRQSSDLIDLIQKNVHDCKTKYAHIMAAQIWEEMIEYNEPTAHNFSYTEEFKAIMSKALPTDCPEKLISFVQSCNKVDYNLLDSFQFQLLELIAASNSTQRSTLINSYLNCSKSGQCMSRDYVDRIKAMADKLPIENKMEHVFTPLITNKKTFRLVNTLTEDYLKCDGTATKDMFDQQICDFTVESFRLKTGVYKLATMTGTLSVHSEAKPTRKTTIEPGKRFSDGQGWTFQLDNDGKTFQIKNRFYDEILVTKDGQACTTKAVEGPKQAAWEVRYKPVVITMSQ